MGGCRLVVGSELIMVGRRIGHVAGVWQHLLVVESALGVVYLFIIHLHLYGIYIEFEF